MGKHSSPRSNATGSLFSAFKSSKKSGRHSPQRSGNTAGGVLAKVRTRPVLSAFVVPTVATAAVVASSLAMVPDSTSGDQQVVAESPVVAASEVTQSPDEFLAKAKKQAKEKPGEISLESKIETPSPSPSSAESPNTDSSTGDSGTKGSSGSKDKKAGKSTGESGSCPMSYYGGGDGFDGQQTANGEIFDTNKLTAAHKTLPFGSKVKITNQANGKSVTVRINDRGPYHGARCIDLSKAAMEAVGGVGAGQITGDYEVQ